MFFDEDRLVVMREMIFADTPGDRAAALARLLPMQRADFVQLFEIMQGLPVCIRLFDPPLHEFLPSDREGCANWPRRWTAPVEVTRRAEALTEVEPDAGHARGAAGGRPAGNLRHAGAGDLRGDAGIRPPRAPRWCPRS
jgi:pyruvate,orthophosphate dikinase